MDADGDRDSDALGLGDRESDALGLGVRLADTVAVVLALMLDDQPALTVGEVVTDGETLDVADAQPRQSRTKAAARRRVAGSVASMFVRSGESFLERTNRKEKSYWRTA